MTGAGREFHLVVWGSTGFTGKQSCKYLAHTYGLPSEEFKYAIAGRNNTLLEEVETQMIKAAEDGPTDHNRQKKIVKIVASVEDEESIVGMCRRADCILTYAGPYTVAGEVTVKACAENGTHYIDITGEVDWVAKMRAKYNATAIKNKVKIVPCCGFDFVPNDIAMMFLHKACANRNLKLKSATQYITLNSVGVSGGTIRSAMVGIFNQKLSKVCCSLQNQFRMCDTVPDPSVIAASKSQRFIGYNKEFSKWTNPCFFGPLMESYLRWSNEVQSFPWGKNLILRVLETSDGICSSIGKYLLYILVPAIILLFAKVPFLAKFIPASGSGTFDYDEASTKDDKYGGVIVTSGEAVEDKTQDTKIVTCRFQFRGDPYKFTTRTSVEAALTCIFDKTPDHFGVTSPSGSLGEAYVARLTKVGVDLGVNSVNSK